MSEENTYKRAGEILAEVRKSKNISLEEVSEVTKIRKVFLQAIEESNYSELPETVYSCGFVRSYAKLFGLDYASLSEQFKAESASGIVSAPIKTVLEPEDEMESSLPDKKTVIGVLFLAALAYAGWTAYNIAKEKMMETTTPARQEFVSTVGNATDDIQTETISYEESDSKTLPVIEATDLPKEKTDGVADLNVNFPAVTETATSEVQEKTAQNQINVKDESFTDDTAAPIVDEPDVKAEAAAPASYGKKQGSRVTLEAEKEVWVQVENDTKILFSRILAKGDKYYVPSGDSTLRLRAGNSDAIAVYVDDKRVSPLAKQSTILRNVSIDADALLAREM